MEVKEAYLILKAKNPILKPLSPGSALWKKVVLEYLSAKIDDKDLKKAICLVAISLDDDEVYREYFKFFHSEEDDDVRRFMAEILKDNCNEIVIDNELTLLGVRKSPFDRYVRQIASQNITNAIKQLSVTKPFKANLLVTKLKKYLLNDENTFTRMNAAIILRNLGDKKSIEDLEKRLEVERKLLEQGNPDIGIPYVIRELERSINFLKERQLV